MIGNGDEVDNLMKHTHETSILKARSFVIFQWLTVLKKLIHYMLMLMT